MHRETNGYCLQCIIIKQSPNSRTPTTHYGNVLNLFIAHTIQSHTRALHHCAGSLSLLLVLCLRSLQAWSDHWCCRFLFSVMQSKSPSQSTNDWCLIPDLKDITVKHIRQRSAINLKLQPKIKVKIKFGFFFKYSIRLSLVFDEYSLWHNWLIESFLKIVCMIIFPQKYMYIWYNFN